MEPTHGAPPATGIASFRSATICTSTLQDVYVNKLMVDIELYFPVSADFIPVSRKFHIIKQLFLCKMRTLLNYSCISFERVVLKSLNQGLGKPNKIYVCDLLKADNSNWLPKQFKHRKGRTNEKEIL